MYIILGGFVYVFYIPRPKQGPQPQAPGDFGGVLNETFKVILYSMFYSSFMLTFF